MNEHGQICSSYQVDLKVADSNTSKSSSSEWQTKWLVVLQVIITLLSWKNKMTASDAGVYNWSQKHKMSRGDSGNMSPFAWGERITKSSNKQCKYHSSSDVGELLHHK